MAKLSDQDQSIYDAYMSDMSKNDPDSFKFLAGKDQSWAFEQLKNEPDFNDFASHVYSNTKTDVMSEASNVANQVWQATKNVVGAITPQPVKDVLDSTVKGLAPVKGYINKGADALEDVGGINPASDFMRATSDAIPTSKAGVALLAAGPLGEAFAPEIDAASSSIASGLNSASDSVSSVAKDLVTNPEVAKIKSALNVPTIPSPITGKEWGPLDEGTYIAKKNASMSQSFHDYAQEPFLNAQNLAKEKNIEFETPNLDSVGEKYGVDFKKHFPVPGGTSESIGGTDAEGNALPDIHSYDLEDALSGRNNIKDVFNRSNKAMQSDTPELQGQQTDWGRIHGEAVDSLDKDIANGTKDHPAISAELSEGRDRWADYKSTYANPTIRAISNKSPEEIADYVYGSTKKINALAQASGTPGVDSVRRSLVLDVLRDPDPQSALSKLKDKPDSFDRIFTASQASSLEQATKTPLAVKALDLAKEKAPVIVGSGIGAGIGDILGGGYGAATGATAGGVLGGLMSK